MDRRSEELKVNKSTWNSILTAVITNNAGNSNDQIIGLWTDSRILVGSSVFFVFSGNTLFYHSAVYM